jgi:hypothetical protein
MEKVRQFVNMTLAIHTVASTQGHTLNNKMDTLVTDACLHWDEECQDRYEHILTTPSYKYLIV